MNTNPDIDRISLEDRVNALELRLPLGGAGLGAIPYCHPDVIEATRINEFTKVDGGWLIKIDIQDTGTIAGASQGMSIKAAWFFPVINDLICSASQCVAQVTFKNTASYPLVGTSINYDFKPTDLSFFDAAGLPWTNQFGLFGPFWIQSNLLVTVNATPNPRDISINFQLVRGSLGMLRFHFGFQGLTAGAIPLTACSCHGVIFTPPMSLGVYPAVSLPGSQMRIGGVPISSTGYTKALGAATPSHPVVKFLPPSWR